MLGLGSGLELKIGLWLAWYLGLACGSVYQYSGGVQEEIFPQTESLRWTL